VKSTAASLTSRVEAVKQQTTEKQGYGELQELVSLLNFFRMGLSLRISTIVKKKM
jgi:hypothetical protein